MTGKRLSLKVVMESREFSQRQNPRSSQQNTIFRLLMIIKKLFGKTAKTVLPQHKRAEYERLNAEAQQQATAAAEPKAKPIKGLEN